jgi:hypothetical protein
MINTMLKTRAAFAAAIIAPAAFAHHIQNGTPSQMADTCGQNRMGYPQAAVKSIYMPYLLPRWTLFAMKQAVILP